MAPDVAITRNAAGVLEITNGTTGVFRDLKLRSLTATSSVYLATTGGNVGIGTTTPSARLSITQSVNTSAGGLWIAEVGNTDFRSIFMDTSGIMSFYGGDTGGTLNTATLNAAGEWTNASDRVYKDNIVNLSYGLEDLMKLQPRSYTIKNSDLNRVGFIAQEVELIIPEVVAGEEGSKGISYGNLVAVVVKAVQELKIKLDGILAWFSDSKLSIQNEVCVDDVCVTKEEFKTMLLNAKENNVVVPENTSSSENVTDTVIDHSISGTDTTNTTTSTSNTDTTNSTGDVTSDSDVTLTETTGSNVDNPETVTETNTEPATNSENTSTNSGESTTTE